MIMEMFPQSGKMLLTSTFDFILPKVMNNDNVNGPPVGVWGFNFMSLLYFSIIMLILVITLTLP